MSFDIETLRQSVQLNGKVARVVITDVRGSAPRETGASMLVWGNGQSGTIGGGALELDASKRARAALKSGNWLDQYALGPSLGQCCGGSVSVLCEVYDQTRMPIVEDGTVLRRIKGSDDRPLLLSRQLAATRSGKAAPETTLADGWFIEPVSAPHRKLWIYGAGHVGRAIVNVLSPLPDFDITWVDCATDRFPAEIPERCTRLVAENPPDAVRYAPNDAEHLILTFSHTLDLEICHRLLKHGFKSAGVIGSKTKWRRFTNRLGELGHGSGSIARINCPIGHPDLGKHPHSIAVGVAASLLSRGDTQFTSIREVG